MELPELLVVAWAASEAGGDVRALTDHAAATLALQEAERRIAERDRKWQDYERDYILPCFKWADEVSFDLRAAVAEADGNCVDRLVRHLRSRAESAEQRVKELEAALGELVALKAIKGRADSISPVEPGFEKEILTDDYRRRQPIAWDRARAALAGSAPANLVEGR